jgi:hypothetical protein
MRRPHFGADAAVARPKEQDGEIGSALHPVVPKAAPMALRSACLVPL